MSLPQHPGATAYIVGRGPSLLDLAGDDFGPGPVITLNAAIIRIRALRLANPLYFMWKDGCQAHTWLDNDPGDHDCRLPQPLTGETFVTSLAEGRFCLPDAPDRIVLDVEQQFGIPWWTMSAPVAVEFAHAMGCTRLVMLGHDAYTSGGSDTRRVLGDGGVEADPHAGYYLAGAKAQELADGHGLSIEWRVKVAA